MGYVSGISEVTLKAWPKVSLLCSYSCLQPIFSYCFNTYSKLEYFFKTVYMESVLEAGDSTSF